MAWTTNISGKDEFTRASGATLVRTSGKPIVSSGRLRGFKPRSLLLGAPAPIDGILRLLGCSLWQRVTPQV